jgi:hypothetical protein
MNPILNIHSAKCWYNDNWEFHREDGPAIECYDGSKEYYINGKLHRIDGPAVERFFNGSKEWFINGIRIDCKDNKEFLRIVKMKELL